MKFGGAFDSEAVKKRIAEKEAVAGDEGFWNDPKKAEKLLSEIKKLKNRILRICIIYSKSRRYDNTKVKGA